MVNTPIILRRVLTGAITLTLVLTLRAADGTQWTGQLSNRQTWLECRHYPDLFPAPTDGRTPVQLWRDTYHKTVAEVIAAHMDPAQKEISCTEGTIRQATRPLTVLAQSLPPWRNGAAFTEESMPSILLAYLSTYECALNARADHPVLEEILPDRNLIEREQLVARAALHRTLRYVGAMDRLEPMESGFVCLERASLDIRNNMSLISEVAACHKDGRSSLRDLIQ